MKNRDQKNREREHLARLTKEYRKVFFARLKTICNQLAGYDLYSKIPTHYLEKLYLHRLRHVSLDMDDTFEKREREHQSELFKMFLDCSFELPNGRGPVLLSIQLVEGHTLLFLAAHVKDNEFPAAREMRETLSVYQQDDYLIAFATRLKWVVFMLGFAHSQFDDYFIRAHSEMERSNSNGSARYVIRLRKITSIKESFVIDGHARPAYRVGWVFPSSDMTWAEIKADAISKGQGAMPVFIQSHALQRLQERIALPLGSMHHGVHNSITNLNYHFDSHGRILIDYVYIDKKIGYLVCSIENNRLLIHTFLFITNNGTPEGKRLSQLTGLQSMDKKYLAIDRLNTFLTYKIQDNEFVKNIFIEAGCGHLLDVDTSIFLAKPSTGGNPETIANYLRAIPLLHG